MKKIKLGLISKILIAIVLGVLAGRLPEMVGNSSFIVFLDKVAVTFSEIFGKYLGFIIPLMILAFVTKGIADLSDGAGKLLFLALILSYVSTIVAGSLSYGMSFSIFPHFIDDSMVNQIKGASSNTLKVLFDVPLKPVLDVTSALLLAFILGIFISALRKNQKTVVFYNIFSEFNDIINLVLAKSIIPIIPFFIFGNFVNMSYSGTVFIILNIFIKIFACIFTLHILYLLALFILASIFTKRSLFKSIKYVIPAYLTAIGTQSSAATIPVNLECDKKIGVSEQIRDFVIPLCATCHMPGSMITITACVYTVLSIHGMPHDFPLILQFIAILGVAMVAAPGAPGGAIMSALPFLPYVGISPKGAIASILISLYLTQDSFGTAANVTGDNVISMFVEKIYYKYIIKKPIPIEKDNIYEKEVDSTM